MLGRTNISEEESEQVSGVSLESDHKTSVVFAQPHRISICSPTGHRDVGPQCSEPDAVREGDGQGG